MCSMTTKLHRSALSMTWAYEKGFDNLWLVTNTLSKAHGFLVVLQNLCSYGPTTTQQRAHNRTPAGFTNCFQYTHTHTQVQNSASLHLRQSLV